MHKRAANGAVGPSTIRGMAPKGTAKIIKDYLRGVDIHKLELLEKWLEVPLDSHVGKGLIAQPEAIALPRWKKVKKLTREESDQYQNFALALAKKKNVSRIHLDDWLFRGEHVN